MRRWVAAAVVGSVLALTGCGAGVGVDVTVTGADTGTVVVDATFEHEAAEVLQSDESLLSGLVSTFEGRAGVKPDVERSKERVRVSAQVDYDRLSQVEGITGVRSVTLSEDGGDIRAVVEVGPAAELSDAFVDAVAASVGKGADGKSVAGTMLASTTLDVTVRFPGGIVGDPVLSESTAGEVEQERKSVTLKRSAADAQAATLTVTGRTVDVTRWAFVGALGVLAALGVAVAVVRGRR